MFAAVAPILVDLGTIAGALVALGAAARLRPAKWLARRLVAQPVTEWVDATLDGHLAPIKAELSLNRGSSLKDAVVRIDRQVHELRARIEERP